MSEAPKTIRNLPIAPNGFATPWFVHRPREGELIDFRVVDPAKWELAVRKSLCWVCGEKRGVHAAFVIGPMCAVNRVTSEPPSHLECARFSVQTCPFLSNPMMRRSPRDLPEESMAPPGLHLDRNPGASCIWVTKKWNVFRADAGSGGYLIRLGDPELVEWWCRGRAATRTEVMDSIESGYPELEKLAKLEGHAAIAELKWMRQRAERYLPVAA